MRYLLKFRSTAIDQNHLPDWAKLRKSSGFTRGMVVGAVGTAAAVTVLSLPPPRKTTLVIVDVSKSMTDREREKPLDRYIARLRASGANFMTLKATGFGLRGEGDSSSLLGVLRKAAAVNPSIESAYLFSDFNCQTPDFDESDEGGRQEFKDIIRNRGIRLFIGRLSQQDAPDEDLVTFAKESGGDWIDEDDTPVRDRTAIVKDVRLTGDVLDGMTGSPIPGVKVFLAGFSARIGNGGRTYTLEVPQVLAGAREVVVTVPDRRDPVKVPVMIPACQIPNKDINLNISVPPQLQQGEMIVTLNWTRNDVVPFPQPYDLDMHLTGPKDRHVYFEETHPSLGFAALDLDNVKACSCPAAETMRFYPSQMGSGTYSLHICDYLGENNAVDGIARSKALVRVFDEHGVREYKATKAGREWTVFSFDANNKTIKDLDEYRDGTSLKGCLAPAGTPVECQGNSRPECRP